MSEAGTIKVLIVEPQKDPYSKEIDNELKPLQEIVGGYLESVTISNRVVVLCNEDGKSLNLKRNSSIFHQRIGKIDFVGTYVFAAHDGNGEFASLTDEDITLCLSCILP